MKVGETTKLKSGGPLMTIISINNNIIECSWFEKDNHKPHNKCFPEDCLLSEQEIQEKDEELLKLQLGLMSL